MNPLQIAPDLTPLLIGRGVRLEGRIDFQGAPGDRLVVLGEFKGSLDWNGVVQIPKGGKIEVETELKCSTLVVGGSVVSTSEESIVTADELVLGPDALIQAGLIKVPAGNLEQARGATINGRLQMVEAVHTVDISVDEKSADSPEQPA